MRRTIEKLIAIVGALLIGIGVYFAPPLKLGAVCSNLPFSGKPTASLSLQNTSDILSEINADSRITNNLNSVISAIDFEQEKYKLANGHYFKGGALSSDIPVLGATVSSDNENCKNKDGKSWMDFAILNAPLPFNVGVSPYTRGDLQGYTIEFFVQKGGRTFLKSVSRGFEATQRTQDWHLSATAEGLAINKRSLVKDISKLKKIFRPYYALAVDANSRDFEVSNGDYAQATPSSDIVGFTAYTFDFEINFESLAGDERLIDRTIQSGGTSAENNYRVINRTTGGGAISVDVTHWDNTGANPNTTSLVGTATINTGTWYRWTIKHDGSGNLTLYNNCTEEDTGTNLRTLGNTNTDGKFRLGAQSNASDAQTVEKLDGLLNNVAIYKAVVTPTASNEADGIDLSNANLVAYWNLENDGLDTATGDAVSDNLTFTGAVNSTNVAGTLCASSATVGDESIMFGDIF